MKPVDHPHRVVKVGPQLGEKTRKDLKLHVINCFLSFRCYCSHIKQIIRNWTVYFHVLKRCTTPQLVEATAYMMHLLPTWTFISTQNLQSQ